MTLDMLKRHKLFAKESKCKFWCQEVGYLDYIISGQGVRADPNKLRAMVDWPQPRTLKALRGSLGLTGYYMRFIKNHGVMVAALTAILRKNSFQWNEIANLAFIELKKAMTQPPILALPDFPSPLCRM